MPTKPATTPTYSSRELLPKLRRWALARQGLNTSAPFGRGKNAVARAIEHMGYVQIDTISVVERAHHHVLRTRVPNYEPRWINQLTAQGRIFEYWYHAAAYLPIDDYRFAKRDMQRFREGRARWPRSDDHKLMKRVVERIRDEGPLMARDFEDTRSKSGTWWDWKPAKRALEQLFMQGDLVATQRAGFQKTYDLAERALGELTQVPPATEREFAEYLVRTTIRAHGFSSLKGFTHLRRGDELRRHVRDVLEAGIAAGELTRFATDDGRQWFADPGVLNTRAPSLRQHQVRILSPFDNAVILRDRTNALFDFDYTIECYVPEGKRRYGYFCLPLLIGEQLIGRLDAKAHRQDGRFEVKHLQLETDLDDSQRAALAGEIRRFAEFNGCESIQLARTSPARELASFQSVMEQTT